jgi:hypothetical protein
LGKFVQGGQPELSGREGLSPSPAFFLILQSIVKKTLEQELSLKKKKDIIFSICKNVQHSSDLTNPKWKC